MTVFQYHPEILARYPNIVGGVIVAEGLHNSPTSPDLAAEYGAEQAATIKRIGDTPLSNLPSLAAWRSVFSSFGVEPTKYRSAAEALLRRLTKKGDIPNINTLVDIGNLVSIRYALPVAVFSNAAYHGMITVRIADGSEEFVPLDQEAAEHPEPGEVIFADEVGKVLARRWCWRQSAASAAQLDMTQAIVTIEGHHTGARTDIEAALTDLQDLLKRYAGGSFQTDVLSVNNPGI